MFRAVEAGEQYKKNVSCVLSRFISLSSQRIEFGVRARPAARNPSPTPARLASRRLPFLSLPVQDGSRVPPPAGGPLLLLLHPPLAVRDSTQEEGRGRGRGRRRPLAGGGHGSRRRRAARRGTYALPSTPRSPLPRRALTRFLRDCVSIGSASPPGGWERTLAPVSFGSGCRAQFLGQGSWRISGSRRP